MRVLVAEDDEHVARFLSKALSEAHHVVDLATQGEDAVRKAQEASYDVIVMDVMMPVLDGYEVVRRLRAVGNTVPVIYLTAKDEVHDIARGLDVGGDDYLTKPFSIVELLARIRALTRRSSRETTGHVLTADGIELDLLSREARRGERALDLTAKEFDLLQYFLRNRGHALTRTMIAERVWDIRFDFESNLIDVHVARLRKKMEVGNEPRLIQTLKGVGYVFRP